MANDTTLNSTASITDDSSKGAEGSESQAGKAELSTKDNESSNSEDSKLDAETKGEFINALGEKNKKLQEKDEKLGQLSKELEEFKKKERERKIADMSEVERVQYENAELRKQLYEDKVTSFSRDQLKKHGLDNNPMAEIVATNPWLVPEVKKHLPQDATWEQVQQTVEEQLPAYLESLAKKADGAKTESTTTTTTEEKPDNGTTTTTTTDAERPAQATTKRIWKAKEISEMPMADYEKNREEIMRAYTEGRVVS